MTATSIDAEFRQLYQRRTATIEIMKTLKDDLTTTILDNDIDPESSVVRHIIREYRERQTRVNELTAQIKTLEAKELEQ